MEKKMTKKEAFELMAEMAEVKANDEVLAVVAKEVEKLSKPRVMTATQKANLVLVEGIRDTMVEGTVYGYKAITELAPEFAELSAPKVSALMKKLIEDGSVVKKDTAPVTYELA